MEDRGSVSVTGGMEYALRNGPVVHPTGQFLCPVQFGRIVCISVLILCRCRDVRWRELCSNGCCRDVFSKPQF
jgi:hypothetical protein